MIHRSRSIKLVYAFLVGIAITIICVGSLINFHQHHIWHKPLILNLVAYKRDSEKSQKVLFQQDFSGVAELPQSLQQKPLLFFPYLQFIPAGSFIFNEQLISPCGLRAPPAV